MPHGEWGALEVPGAGSGAGLGGRGPPCHRHPCPLQIVGRGNDQVAISSKFETREDIGRERGRREERGTEMGLWCWGRTGMGTGGI